MSQQSQKTFSFVRRHWLTIAFILGFCTDLILLNQVDNLFDNLVLLFYVILGTISMFLLYVGVAEKGPLVLTKAFKKYAPIFMQYSFGGLLSGMLIFYGRSGDWFSSAPFLLLILAVIFGNELIEKRSDRLVYNLALYFTGLFSYIVLVIPVLTGKMGDLVFVISGLLSLFLLTLVIKILYKIIPNFMEGTIKRVILTIGGIYIVFNSFYFLNIIPPIPLSLTKLEIAHSVSKANEGNYQVVSEEQVWYRKLPFIKPELNSTGGSIACFSRVFAPTKLSTKIFHVWEYKDEAGNWKERFRLGYPITGQNKKGYGGYTEIKNFSSGLWRCSVETERGQILGRETVIIDTKGAPRNKQIKFE